MKSDTVGIANCPMKPPKPIAAVTKPMSCGLSFR
jgi:hypothetical protein